MRSTIMQEWHTLAGWMKAKMRTGTRQSIKNLAWFISSLELHGRKLRCPGRRVSMLALSTDELPLSMLR
ncbi:uncharacterized protein A1O9_08020 [Exophiala aquamarina CBS 119918]|uniref:Uncharacterized protein n=1 Tax=Exophiala aquamarina CBS 119918 TaxID=1182545 RepID=A0A072P8L2_9EURO|nr:uncharacterized protein A1O9_08020 [Exophiala aquamarina CBS 119918]KEF56439.1 hypothetical protein A1O9_08020 [Exophiala aquamarina CBS 119918]